MCKTSFVSLHKCFNFDKYFLSFYSWLGLMVSVSDLLAKSLKSRIHKKSDWYLSERASGIYSASLLQQNLVRNRWTVAHRH